MNIIIYFKQNVWYCWCFQIKSFFSPLLSQFVVDDSIHTFMSTLCNIQLILLVFQVNPAMLVVLFCDKGICSPLFDHARRSHVLIDHEVHCRVGVRVPKVVCWQRASLCVYIIKLRIINVFVCNEQLFIQVNEVCVLLCFFQLNISCYHCPNPSEFLP